MTEREHAIYNCLHEACGLISIEMRGHLENQIPTFEQRKDIAKTLRGFLIHATNVLDTMKGELQ